MKEQQEKDRLIFAIKAASQSLGVGLKARDFEATTGISRGLVSRTFGSWHDAMIASGLRPISNRRSITKPWLLEQARNLAAQLGSSSISISEWKKHAICDDGLIRRRFGSWANFNKEAGLAVTKKRDIPNDVLLAELKRLHQLLGKRVSENDMDFHGRFSRTIYKRRWGSWRKAWECYMEVGDTLPDLPAEDTGQTPLPGRQYYGDIIDMPGLLRAPVNELGVIYLFALLSKRLGYSVEGIQANFPDAIGKRKLSGQKYWESARIEFEFESSSFKKHGHDPKGCDVVICWDHNWKACPVAVLELKSLVKKVVK